MESTNNLSVKTNWVREDFHWVYKYISRKDNGWEFFSSPNVLWLSFWIPGINFSSSDYHHQQSKNIANFNKILCTLLAQILLSFIIPMHTHKKALSLALILNSIHSGRSSHPYSRYSSLGCCKNYANALV